MITEEQIRAKEKQAHFNVAYKYKGKTLYHPKIDGYLTEDLMQADFYQWAVNYHPALRGFIFHIKNEGDSGSSFARLKAAQDTSKGKLPGVFDNLSVYKNRMVFIELKLPSGTWSDDQKKLKALWETQGIEVLECRTFDRWKWIIEEYILKF